jgi:hypothetical protein
MEEVFPVLAGVALGLATNGVKLGWLRSILIAFLGLAFGLVASWISGELAISWTYALIDVAQVIGVAVMTVVGLAVWRRRLRSKLARE